MNIWSKQEARAATKAARAALSVEERAVKSKEICRRLLALPELAQAHTILSYAPLPGEVDLKSLHEALAAAGKRICFPVTGDGGTMETVLPGPGAAWKSGSFGIREPEGAPVPPEEIELVLAPCLAFDDRGTRLGWGGGYYDRYLARCPQAWIIAVAFECQRMADLPREEHDRPADMAVTEEGIYCF